MRSLRAAAWMAAAAVVMGAAPPPDLHGPLSDFWLRVKRDWSVRLTGLNHGPLQTAIWVAMIWDGPDPAAVEQIAGQLQEREAKRWVRAQITKDRYADISRRDLSRLQALRQNVILLGTPEDNKLVARALESTPLRAGRGYVTLPDRRLEGDGLLLIAITPNPVDPRHYALVITGSSASAIQQAGQVPYGETDYVVFRGRKPIERGFFDWTDGAPGKKAVKGARSFAEHFNWAERDTTRFRMHFDPSRASTDDLDRFGRKIDAELEEAAGFYGIREPGPGKIDLYLYDSVDEKLNQTADPRPAQFSSADESLHVVWPGGWDLSLAARILLRHAVQIWGDRAERELPGFALALSLACRDRFQTIPLSIWAARSTRDTGYVPMDLLFARDPRELETGDLSVLDAAAFTRDLILREGAQRVALFYRTARRSDFHDRFRDLFGTSISQAESRWLKSLGAAAATRQDALVGAQPDTAAALSLSARVHFRNGEFDAAVAAAQGSIAAAGGSAEDRAWARLTLGRARAMKGLLVAAGADFRAEEIRSGPDQVRVIADFWLEHLGVSLNGRAANQFRMQQADGDLMNFDWEAAETKLRAVLASDPLNSAAHAALGQVYLSRYQYWYDYMLLDRELFPGDSQADPEVYRFLAQKGRAELRLADSLPDDDEGLQSSETGPVEPGVDQPMPHLLVCKASMLRGDYATARREVDTALAMRPRETVVVAFCHLYEARIAAATGDPVMARAEYEAVISLSAGGEVTRLARQELDKLEPSAEK